MAQKNRASVQSAIEINHAVSTKHNLTSKKFVIPAGMPESSAMDGNLTAMQEFNRSEVPVDSFTSM
jgi:hypothetical protein